MSNLSIEATIFFKRADAVYALTQKAYVAASGRTWKFTSSSDRRFSHLMVLHIRADHPTESEFHAHRLRYAINPPARPDVEQAYTKVFFDTVVYGLKQIEAGKP